MVDVAIENLTKSFGKVVAVKKLNMRVNDKEFLILLGPSGCGKTTTLRLIAGLEIPTSGYIYIGGSLVNELPPKDRNVAMVFQSYALYPHMSVYDNIAFPLKMHKFSKPDIDKRVKETAELLQIGELLDRKPRELSGGQRQRVALGRAVVREPAVFLMDEPLSNLDAKLRVYMRAELKRLQKRIGITTIYVTHDQVEAMTMADRIALMDQGLLQQISTPKEIYDNPSNLFVAGFIGSPPMNFLSCSFVEKREEAFVDCGSFSINVSSYREIIRTQATGEELIFGIRPEDISACKKRPAQRSIRAEVYVTEPLGNEMLISLKLGDSILRARCISTLEFGIGDEVWISFETSKIHIFDAKTGKPIV